MNIDAPLRDNPFRTIDLHLKLPRNKIAEPEACHLRRIVIGIEYREFKNGAEKAVVPAKCFGPFTKRRYPFFPVAFEIVPAVEDKLQLIVAVKFEPEYT